MFKFDYVKLTYVNSDMSLQVAGLQELTHACREGAVQGHVCATGPVSLDVAVIELNVVRREELGHFLVQLGSLCFKAVMQFKIFGAQLLELRNKF